jgi:hypothetical protein
VIDGDAPDGFVPFERRINLNGPAYTGIDFPGMWEADPGTGGVCGPTPYTAPTQVVGTNDGPLFVGQIYSSTAVTCSVAGLPPGNYQVTLLFGNTYFHDACPGGLVNQMFDIQLEGATVLSNLDLDTEAGGCMANGGNGHPVTKQFTVAVTDGALDINEPAKVSVAMLSAIQIVKVP